MQQEIPVGRFLGAVNDSGGLNRQISDWIAEFCRVV
jgi:hypothetical protein